MRSRQVYNPSLTSTISSSTMFNMALKEYLGFKKYATSYIGQWSSLFHLLSKIFQIGPYFIFLSLYFSLIYSSAFISLVGSNLLHEQLLVCQRLSLKSLIYSCMSSWVFLSRTMHSRQVYNPYSNSVNSSFTVFNMALKEYLGFKKYTTSYASRWSSLFHLLSMIFQVGPYFVFLSLYVALVYSLAQSMAS